MTTRQLLPDRFTLMLVSTVVLASVLPARRVVAADLETLTTVGIGLLFFLHGAKLSRSAVAEGAAHWRLHLLVFVCTFVLFPLLGLGLKPLLRPLVTPQIYTGVLFLCVLPATVQSAIAFTSMARGNVPAAVCSASASTLLGVFLTPLLVGVLVIPHGSTGASLDSVWRILLQLMAPFAAGQLLRPWIGERLKRHGAVLGLVDRGSILLVVYTAFSAAVIEGLWRQIPLRAFGRTARGMRSRPGLHAALEHLARAPLWFRKDRRDHHRVLRLEEEPRQRHPDGEHPVSGASGGYRRAAADAVSPTPADGVRRARAALCAARR
jgi:sodium/bile acid cotransporter 7